ncbi:MAG: hypothetical protein AAGK97_17035, partial [Bacteroidota bacterium]
MIKKLPVKILCLLALGFVMTFQSCLEDKCDSTRTFVRWDPIYVTAAGFRNTPVTAEAPKELKNPGKI